MTSKLVVAAIILGIVAIAVIGSVFALSLLNFQAATTKTFSTTATFRTTATFSTTVTSSSVFTATSLFTQTSTTLTTSTTTTTTTSTDPYSQNWLTYHRTYWRDGVEAEGLTAFSSASRFWTSAALNGMIYAEPLIANGTVYVATEGDSVYALNEATGGILWRQDLGAPMPASDTGVNISCWTIDPIGITSTPVIDPNTGILYAVGFVQPGQFVMTALSIKNGHEIWSMNIDPQGMNSLTQQQRPALAIANGYVYVGFGGNGGDCEDYQAYLEAVPENGTSGILSYEVPTIGDGTIWGSSGPAIDNATGDILITTGNSNSNGTFDYGETVIKLSPTLQVLEYFTPSNWADLNYGDLDLGSVGPTILNNNTVFQVGKEGVGYLLQMSDLGGIGGQEYSAPICWQGSETNFNGGSYGGVAYDAPYLYVPCLANGLIALKVDLGTSPLFSVVWNSSAFFAGAPIVADGAVWTVDIGGTYLGQNGILYALNPITGQVLFNASIGSVGHFITPSADENLIFVGGNNEIQAFAVK